MRAFLAVVLLSVPAAAKPKPRPAPSLSGTGIYTSTAALPSQAAHPAFTLRSKRSFILLPLVHIEIASDRAATYGDNVAGLVRAMAAFAEAVVEARADGAAEDGSTASNEKFYAGERRFLLGDLAVLQHEVQDSPTPERWSPDAMRWELAPTAQDAVLKRFPRPDDFARRKREKAEHEIEPAKLESGTLEFKP